MHCGFCLPACPTYTRLGDENDSPRGRLYLMRAVVEGRLDAASDAFQTHIDRCVGCRACETVCPSGVPYGHLLELARDRAGEARSRGLLTRLLLAVFASDRGTSAFLGLSRLLRASGLPGLAVRVLPSRGPFRPIRFALAMLAASRPARTGPAGGGGAPDRNGAEASGRGGGALPDLPGRRRPPLEVALLTGCVQEGLFARVNRATERTLRANGCRVHGVEAQGCCGALHAHGGDLRTARDLARRNVDAFEAAGIDAVVVNAAGCGAAMKAYGELLADDPAYADRAAALADRVVDIAEVLVARGAAPEEHDEGGAEEAGGLRVAYDAPCHLLHAQGVDAAPRRLLGAIPGVRMAPLARSDECCGGAGIYGLTHPDLGGRIGEDKVRAVIESGADVVATGNPGCIMQIGAGLRIEGSRVRVVHPVELLDESYWRSGVYRGTEADR